MHVGLAGTKFNTPHVPYACCFILCALKRLCKYNVQACMRLWKEAGTMKTVVELILEEGKSVRSTEKGLNIFETTLQRYVQKSNKQARVALHIMQRGRSLINCRNILQLLLNCIMAQQLKRAVAYKFAVKKLTSIKYYWTKRQVSKMLYLLVCTWASMRCIS